MMHKVLWNLEMQMVDRILVSRPDLVLINKKKRTCYLVATKTDT